MGIAGLIVAAIAAQWPASTTLWRYWIEHPYFAAHGILVAVLALWLLFRTRSRVACAPVRGVPLAAFPLLAGSVVTIVFAREGLQALQLVMLPALMLMAILSAFGTAVTRAVAVPVGFLYFAMPIWDLLAEPLQKLTLMVVELCAPAMGLPISVSGFTISMPRGMTFTVTIWCSGLGMLVQGLAVAALLGELEQAPLGRRLQLLASMLVVALVTNWIRVLAIIQIGYSTDMRHVLVTRYHVLFGYALYALALVAFVSVATWRRRPADPRRGPWAVGSANLQRSQYMTALLALVAAPVIAAALALLKW